MAENIRPSQDSEKLAWEAPELTVVATTADIAGGGSFDDEDFDGIAVS